MSKAIKAAISAKGAWFAVSTTSTISARGSF